MDWAERRTATLTRIKYSPKGTFGELVAGPFHCVTLERPPATMIADHPCIPISPTDDYAVNWTKVHPHHNPCYEVMYVPGRSAILFHPANWFQELLGCIALGERIEDVIDHDGKHLGRAGAKQLGVSSSYASVQRFIVEMKQQDFRLKIQEAVTAWTP